MKQHLWHVITSLVFIIVGKLMQFNIERVENIFKKMLT
jgi:hypothetical protein